MPLNLDARLRRAGDELEVEARTSADHRELGMSHGLLGMIRTPSELIVHGRLVRDAIRSEPDVMAATSTPMAGSSLRSRVCDSPPSQGST